MKTAKGMVASKVDCFNMVGPNDKVIKALQVMKCQGMDFVVVMRDGHFMGIMSESDYAKKVVLVGRKSDQVAVNEIMNNNFPFVDGNDSVDTCVRMMNNFNAHYLPVFETLHFIGVLTMQDILCEALEQQTSIAS